MVKLVTLTNNLVNQTTQSNFNKVTNKFRPLTYLPTVEGNYPHMNSMKIKGAGSGGAGGCPSTMIEQCHKHTNKLEFKKNEKRMKKENAKIVILKHQNLGKSNSCKQKKVPACALLYAVWCVVSNGWMDG